MTVLLLRLVVVQEMNVGEHLTRLTEQVDVLQRQLNQQQKDHKRHLVSEESRLDEIEKTQRLLLDKVNVLDVRLKEHEERTDAVLGGLQRDTTHAMSQLVEKIAQQFDAVQATIDGVVHAQMEREEEVKGALLQLQGSYGELRTCLDTFRQDFEKRVDEKVDNTAFDASSRALEEKTERLESTLDGMRQILDNHQQMIVEENARIERHMESSNKDVEDRCRTWEDMLEQTSRSLQQKFEGYKAYVARLRKDVHTLQYEFRGAQENLITKVSSELEGAERNIALMSAHFNSCR